MATMVARIAQLWRRARPLVRAEAVAAGWETFSAMLYASAVVPATFDTPLPAGLFVLGLVVSALAARPLVARGIPGYTAAAGLRMLLWLGAFAPLLGSMDERLLVATAGFGLMGGALRRTIYRRFLEPEALLGATDPDRVRRELRSWLAESAATAGILGGHVLLLFSATFLRTKSVVLFRGWFEVIPLLGMLGTVGFTLAVRPTTRRVLAAVAAGPGADPKLLVRGLHQAERLPRALALANFVVWFVCIGIGVVYFRVGPTHWNWGDALMQLAFGGLFASGVSFYQRSWQQIAVAPVVALLRAWSGRAPPPATMSVRRRMLRDFGLPLVFSLALSLFASIGLYRTLGAERTLQEDFNAILALVTSFAMLVLAVGNVILRAARTLSAPLVELAAAADRVAAGTLEAAVPEVEAPREVGQLGRSIERMRQSLAQTIQTLEAERAGLETRVDERTAELQNALDELKQTEAALIHNERLASIGQLVAGVAHEIYNPLTAIAGSIASLERIAAEVREMDAAWGRAARSLAPAERSTLEAERLRLDLDGALDDLAGVAKVVKSASRRSVEIVASLKRFARAHEESVAVDLHEGLRETLSLVGHRLRAEQIELRERFGDLPLVQGRAGELNQVFLNLLTNAIQALVGQDGAVIEIGTESDDETATITIADNGPGVPAELRERIFDPFVTTKTRNEGTGLGLSLSRDIVRRHGGTLELARPDAAVGGARFVLRLPLVPPSSPPSRRTRPRDATPR